MVKKLMIQNLKEFFKFNCENPFSVLADAEVKLKESDGILDEIIAYNGNDPYKFTLNNVTKQPDNSMLFVYKFKED
jgi:hypothetical protein